jgi:hypothetical protein
MLQTRVFQYLILSLLLTFYSKFSFAQNFTDEDRARMIRTETKIDALEKRMEDGFNQIDKRFEQVDKRFEQVDKRFEQVDKRFEEHLSYIGYMVGSFGAICAVIIGFTLWDRRTMLKPIEVKVQAIDNELLKVKNNRSNQSKIISVLRELAKSNTKLAEILKWHKLL